MQSKPKQHVVIHAWPTWSDSEVWWGDIQILFFTYSTIDPGKWRRQETVVLQWWWVVKERFESSLHRRGNHQTGNPCTIISSEQTLLNYGWTLDDGVHQPLWYLGAALPNDDEIIQLTEGGKLEEQQEAELITPEIPRGLIGYEWISDSNDSDGEDYQ